MYHKTWYIRMYSANWQTTNIKRNVSGKVCFMKFQIQKKTDTAKQHFTLTASSFYPICHMPRCLNATTSPSRFASRLQSLELELPSRKNTVVLQNIKNKLVGTTKKKWKPTYLQGFTRDILLLLAPTLQEQKRLGLECLVVENIPNIPNISSSIPTKSAPHPSHDTLLCEHWLVPYTNPHKLEIQHQKQPPHC